MASLSRYMECLSGSDDSDGPRLPLARIQAARHVQCACSTGVITHRPANSRRHGLRQEQQTQLLLGFLVVGLAAEHTQTRRFSRCSSLAGPWLHDHLHHPALGRPRPCPIPHSAEGDAALTDPRPRLQERSAGYGPEAPDLGYQQALTHHFAGHQTERSGQ